MKAIIKVTLVLLSWCSALLAQSISIHPPGGLHPVPQVPEILVQQMEVVYGWDGQPLIQELDGQSRFMMLREPEGDGIALLEFNPDFNLAQVYVGIDDGKQVTFTPLNSSSPNKSKHWLFGEYGDQPVIGGLLHSWEDNLWTYKRLPVSGDPRKASRDELAVSTLRGLFVVGPREHWNAISESISREGSYWRNYLPGGVPEPADQLLAMELGSPMQRVKRIPGVLLRLPATLKYDIIEPLVESVISEIPRAYDNGEPGQVERAFADASNRGLVVAEIILPARASLRGAAGATARLEGPVRRLLERSAPPASRQTGSLLAGYPVENMPISRLSASQKVMSKYFQQATEGTIVDLAEALKTGRTSLKDLPYSRVVRIPREVLAERMAGYAAKQNMPLAEVVNHLADKLWLLDHRRVGSAILAGFQELPVQMVRWTKEIEAELFELHCGKGKFSLTRRSPLSEWGTTIEVSQWVNPMGRLEPRILELRPRPQRVPSITPSTVSALFD